MKKNISKPLYLKTLSLKNFATFDDSFIEFDESFNVIAGETGSGKSLILDALCLILGQRADKKLVRKGNEFLILEAVFHCDDQDISDFFDQMGYPLTDHELVVKRIVYANGKSKNYINYGQCNLNDLIVFSKRFIDIVGQFENQKLLSEKYQLVLIDKYGHLSDLLKEYQTQYQTWNEIKAKISELEKQQSDTHRELDFINYQLAELESLNPSVEEEKELIKKKTFFVNFEKRHGLKSELQNLLDEERGLSDLYSIFYKKVTQNSSLFPDLNLEDLELVNEKLGEFSSYFASAFEDEFDQEDFEAVMEKLDLYQKLKFKHKVDTKGLEDRLQELRQKKDNLMNFEVNYGHLQNKEVELQNKLHTMALEIHKNRVKVSKKISDELTKVLQGLNMVGATLEINISKLSQLGPTGIDSVQIMAETNRGEGFYDIKKIASGGELSRILLAFRQVLSSKDTISIFLFDEIDTGIGGETALRIGNSLKQVSESSQVVAITHLPQIASYSTKVLNVIKKFDKEQQRTYSYVEEILGKGQIMKYSKSMSPISVELQ